MRGTGYVWACGIRNGHGGGRIVPLKAGIGSQVMTPYFEPTELGSIGMGAEYSPFQACISLAPLRKPLLHRTGLHSVALVAV